MPSHIRVYNQTRDALSAKPQAVLLVTHRLLQTEEQEILRNGVMYRPKVIVLGIGCNRGTSTEEIERVIKETLDELQFSLLSVKAVCTIDLKKDEAGLLEVVGKNGWEFITYTADELNKAEIEAPSDTVFKFTGAYGVSEPAVKLYTGNGELQLVKKKSGNVTISVGVIQHEETGAVVHDT
jgi:cobalt-precorrin 5A hydrolase